MRHLCKPLLAVVFVSVGFQKNEEEKLPKEVVVKMLRSIVKERPSYTARKVDEIKEGEVIRVVDVRGNWSRIEYGGGKSGWINNSAYIEKELYIPSATAKASGEVREIQEAAAAKGFSPEIEQKYKKEGNLDNEYRILDNEIILTPSFKRSGDSVDLETIIERVRKFRESGGLE